MANQVMKRSDISKSMYVGTKEVFKDCLKRYKTEEWKSIVAMKDSKGEYEEYSTIGNLRAAQEKTEGEAFEYGKVVEGNTTTVYNKTIVNGYSVTMEAESDEKWGIVPTVKTEELARTMMEEREVRVAAKWDGVLVNTGADGAKHASHSHPLIDVEDVYNDNLVEGVFDSENGYAVYESAVTRFNHWKNHQGGKYTTRPSAIVAHADRQTLVLQMLNSEYQAWEQSNTKNTVRKLKPMFNSWISAVLMHVIDETIDSMIFQRRSGLVTEYDYDKRYTFNWFFNVHERYAVDVINPGFGFVTITGAVPAGG